jgi:DNA-binding CsgD family transcriptional regulator
VGSEVGLTPRELEILSLVAQGRSNSEIARETYLGMNTIKSHVRNAYAKIGATNRSQATAWAIQHGLPSREG